MPIIGFTSHAASETLHRGRAAGFDEIVEKALLVAQPGN